SAVIAGTLLAQSHSRCAIQLAQALATGETTVTLAWQERAGQIGVSERSATRIANGKLTGRKLYVPAWHAQTALLVAAVGTDGPAIVIVDPTASGVSVATQRMTDATTSATISFDGVVLGEGALILDGHAAQSALELALARGTVALSAQLEGLAGAL